MKPEQIAQKAKIRNIVNICLAAGLFPVSLVLWYLSFQFFRYTMYFILDVFFYEAWSESFYVALLCLIPLGFEGFRRTRPLFDPMDYFNSDLYDNFFNQSGSRQALNVSVAIFYITNFLYCAPRSMALAFQFFSQRLPEDEVTMQNAARILAELKATRKWTSIETYDTHRRAVYVLRQLGLIWLDDKSDVLIRYPAGES